MTLEFFSSFDQLKFLSLFLKKKLKVIEKSVSTITKVVKVFE